MFLTKSNLFFFLSFFVFASCQKTTDKPKVIRTYTNVQHDGDSIFLFKLTNAKQMEVELLSYGGLIRSIKAPDRNGNLEDVTLGFDSTASYLIRHPRFGSTMGRFANRISNAKFEIDGQVHQLEINAPPHHIHGGDKGFDRLVWESEIVESSDAAVRFWHDSPDGYAGFPGNVSVEILFTLSLNNELRIDYKAMTDKATHLNMTNHSYFNLNGATSTIHDHQLKIMADSLLEVNNRKIPTGVILAVENTPFDFRNSTRIGEQLDQLESGFDHHYVLGNDRQLKQIASIFEPNSGRVLEVSTTQPGVQFYTPNGLNQRFTGKANNKYVNYMGFCLETQHYPDAPNHPHFPSTLLRPGETYQETVIFKFSVR